MIIRLVFLLAPILTMVFGCSDDDRPGMVSKIEQQEQRSEKDSFNLDSTFQFCDSLFIATYHGTACCVSGPAVAKPGDIFTYHYQINHADANVSWQILEGDISIIAGQDTHTVTVRFGTHFTGGTVFGDGNGISSDYPTRLRCTDRVIVVVRQ